MLHVLVLAVDEPGDGQDDEFTLADAEFQRGELGLSEPQERSGERGRVGEHLRDVVPRHAAEQFGRHGIPGGIR